MKRGKSVRVISWNVNGLRSIHRKGFLPWFEHADADIVCLQEIKLQEDQIPEPLRDVAGYELYCNTGTRKGYAGVAVYTTVKPVTVSTTMGMERFDEEGRFLRLDFPDLILIAVYMPQGGRDKANLPYKLAAYDRLLRYLADIKHNHVIVIGDLNIAHAELDLARPKQNMRNIMFTPEERSRLDALVQLGFIDTFRAATEVGGRYTWWPYRAHARERNIGWRIDYTFVSKSLASAVYRAFILSDVTGSDHCPVGIDLDIGGTSLAH